MIQRCFAGAAKSRNRLFSAKFDIQYLRGSVSLRGHSMSNRSGVRGWVRLWSRCAGRMRTAAKILARNSH
jgi:hypothetical protein